MEIQLLNDQSLARIDTKAIRRKIRIILRDLGYPEAELSIVLIDDQKMARLNETFRGRPNATNVLAFPQREGEFGDLNPNLLGDVVVSVETAAREAETAGLCLEEVIDRLIVHGILHLIGYDHQAAETDAAAMEAESRRLVDLLAGEGGP